MLPMLVGYRASMDSNPLGASPNCERCLVPLVVDGPSANPFWRCPTCNVVRLV